MDKISHFKIRRLCAAALLLALAAMPATAQQGNAARADDGSFFGTIGRWLDDSFSTIGSQFKGAEKNIDQFGHEAGVAAKATAGAAKDAASAVTRLPTARIKTGHQNCLVAPNGGADCSTAADKLCQAHGFSAGKSLDVTSAEECPPVVMLGQRAALPGECKKVTFVSRALCQ